MNIQESAFIPIIIAVVQFAKSLGLPSKLASPLAIVLGVGLTLSNGMFYVERVIQGIITGLAAAGFYSGAKSIIGK